MDAQASPWDQHQKTLALAQRAYQAKDFSESERICRQIVEIQPENPFALHLLGLSVYPQGRQREAVTLLQLSIALKPNVAEFHNNLGVLWGQVGRHEHAAAACARAAKLQPHYAEAHANLGIALEQLGEAKRSEVACRTALRLQPTFPRAKIALAAALRAQGRLDEALSTCNEALAHKQDNPHAWVELARVCEELGEIRDAVDAYRMAVNLKPTDALVHSALLYALHHDPAASPELVLLEHLEWARRHAEPLYLKNVTYTNVLDPGRRLRIGYVSPDFRAHSVAIFLEPLIIARDREQFEVFCYSDVHKPDDITLRIRAAADVWVESRSAPDVVLADLIRRDQIDILIDPTGHMSGNRLGVFARKPAPIQVAFSGYPGSTGLKTMDYFVTDPIQHPSGSSGDTLYADGYSESLLVLPRSSRCYQPQESAPSVESIPSPKNGYVTFGSLNRPSKFNEPILQAWALLLRELADAKLLILVGDVNDAEASRLYGPLMKRNGIPMERLEWAGRRPVAKYLELYNRVDVALDTFPYNGCTTSCDALWMGVPLVTLAGKTMVSRVGASILHQVVLDDLVSETPEQYVETARSIALDVGRRNHLRSTLRSRMRHSSLVNATIVPADLGSALREVWVRSCARSVDAKRARIGACSGPVASYRQQNGAGP